MLLKVIQNITKKLIKKEVINLSKTCYFKNKDTGEEFSKTFTNEKDYSTFMIKCRYSKKITCIGKEQWV